MVFALLYATVSGVLPQAQIVRDCPFSGPQQQILSTGAYETLMKIRVFLFLSFQMEGAL